MRAPNVNPQTYDETAGHLTAAVVVLCLLDILAVGGRFYARKKEAAPLRADDWFSAAALLFTLTFGIFVLYGVSQHSMGYRVVFPPDFAGSPLEFISPQTRLAGLVQFSYQILTPLANGCYKASILFFYRHVFVVTNRTFGHVVTVSIVIIMAWMIGYFFTFLFQCGTEVYWQWAIPAEDIAHCEHQISISLSLCISDFATDVIILLMPAPLVWQMNMSRLRKLAVIAMFAIGSSTVIASLIRMIKQIDLVEHGFDPHFDQIYFLTREAYWVIVVMGTGTLSVCLPSLHIFSLSSLSAIFRSTRDLFYFLTSKSRADNRDSDAEGRDSFGESKKQASGSQDYIVVHKAVDVGYASSGKSSRSGKVPMKSPSRENYLTSTTETYAMSDLRASKEP
ncbi:hypothetical protein GQ53DRAFT_819509 [Thozetella sp. PMI_491]|nr:hypothetical protein GQ53DRAFT_819509 [Thozetella sp. PMI_491]